MILLWIIPGTIIVLGVIIGLKLRYYRNIRGTRYYYQPYRSYPREHKERG